MPSFNKSFSLAATGSSEGFRISGPFHVVLSGTWVGTVALEALVDGETAWANCLLPDATANAFTTTGLIAVPNVFGDGIQFRVTFTRTSGTVTGRFVG